MDMAVKMAHLWSDNDSGGARIQEGCLGGYADIFIETYKQVAWFRKYAIIPCAGGRYISCHDWFYHDGGR
jgi:hypothetical protein